MIDRLNNPAKTIDKLTRRVPALLPPVVVGPAEPVLVPLAVVEAPVVVELGDVDVGLVEDAVEVPIALVVPFDCLAF